MPATKTTSNAASPASEPPWRATAADAGFLSRPSQTSGGGDDRRSPAQIDQANKEAFAQLRPMWAKRPPIAGDVVQKTPRQRIMELLAKSGIPQSEWRQERLCDISFILRVRDAIQTIASATSKETAQAQFSHAKLHDRLLQIAAQASREALAQAAIDFYLDDRDPWAVPATE
jgi:hypothetical protein